MTIGNILAPFHFLVSLMIAGGLSRPGGEMLRPAGGGTKRWEQTFLHPFTLPPQKESTNNIYLCYNGGSKAPGNERTTAFWPSAASPCRVPLFHHPPARFRRWRIIPGPEFRALRCWHHEALVVSWMGREKASRLILRRPGWELGEWFPPGRCCPRSSP